MRRVMGRALTVVALLAALVVVLMAWAGRNVTASDRFAETVVRTLQSDPAGPEVADLVVARIDRVAARRGVAVPAATRDAIRGGVRSALGTPAFARSATAALERVHAQVLEHPTGVPVDLGLLREPVLAAVDPVAATLIPPREQFPTLVVPLPDGARTAVRMLRAIRDAWPLAIPVALAALVGAVLVTGDRSRPLRTAGVGLMAFGLLPPLLRLVTPALAGGVAPASTDATARSLGEELTRGWLVAGAWTAVAGLGLIVLAALARPRRAARRRR